VWITVFQSYFLYLSKDCTRISGLKSDSPRCG
jgi:hypothetical protein